MILPERRVLNPPSACPAMRGVPCIPIVLLFLVLLAPVYAAETAAPLVRWWKGNLHTHTLWSDGDDYPEMVVDWYKKRGYHFLALSDHNVVLEGEKWISTTKNKGGEKAFQQYVGRFGKKWVKTREVDGLQQVRLRTLPEFRLLFEKKNQFLLIPSEEISDQLGKAPVHLNATNLRDLILPQGGSNVVDVLQRNINAVLTQRTNTGQAMLVHVNHPNFGWAVTAEDLMQVHGERFFEVYNGHPQVHNDGDSVHPGTERLWDILLTWRLGVLGLDVMYGLAVDDAHNYHFDNTTNSNAGRGWVMVRSPRLTTEDLMSALEAGDFYASTGVKLKDLHVSTNQISLEIEAQQGITYTTLFLGTLVGFDRTVAGSAEIPGLAHRVTRDYSDEIGQVLAEVDGPRASYTIRGDELYVRAKVVSSKSKYNPYTPGELEICWTQPVVVGRAAASPTLTSPPASPQAESEP